ncbi:MAG: hypothetical protein J7K40_15470 [candidate division Zixibacteria bacterium]|nr:hypothetical protein [candidate division Zixibacteria bacterium]
MSKLNFGNIFKIALLFVFIFILVIISPQYIFKTVVSKLDIKSLINILAIAVSASLLLWQLKKQHKNNIELQRENNKDKLKLEIFKEYSKTITDAREKISSIQGAAYNITTSLTSYSTLVSMGINPSPISQREVIFRDAHDAASIALTDLMFLVEKYEIINPNLKIFSAAFGCAHYDMWKTFPPFLEILTEYLPYDVPKINQEGLDTNVIIPKTPSEDDIKKVSEIAQPYIENLIDAQFYVYDLAREAQNILLGSLFNRRIPIRKPVDPNYVGISTSPDDVAKLEKYFYEETEWGKEQKRAAEKAKEEVNKDI